MGLERTLLLVGHGSQHGPESAAPVHAAARRIRRLGVFDEVRVAFWKEPPWLWDAAEAVRSPDITIVPLFLADGWFAGRVVPDALGLRRVDEVWAGRVVRYREAIGTDPAMAELVERRARDALGEACIDPAEAELIVAGHGTDRSPDSATTTYAAADALRSRGRFARVRCGFLDQRPRLTDVVEAASPGHVVIVPFFLAEGWHTRVTLPRSLGLEGPTTARNGRTIHYTRPVGTLPDLATAVLQRALTEDLEGSG